MTYRRQAIIWTNADPTHWDIYAALGGDELKRPLTGICLLVKDATTWGNVDPDLDRHMASLGPSELSTTNIHYWPSPKFSNMKHCFRDDCQISNLYNHKTLNRVVSWFHQILRWNISSHIHESQDGSLLSGVWRIALSSWLSAQSFSKFLIVSN